MASGSSSTNRKNARGDTISRRTGINRLKRLPFPRSFGHVADGFSRVMVRIPRLSVHLHKHGKHTRNTISDPAQQAHIWR